MKKTTKYNSDGTLTITFQFTKQHVKTLYQIFANEGYVAFENRDPNIFEDVDGNSISWKICDELVDMGLLKEDEESFDIYFEITKTGVEILTQLKNE